MTLDDLAPRIYTPDTDGIYTMTDPEYRQAPLVSQSMLKELRRSPAHLVAYLSRPPKKPTEAQVIGILTDHALLEPDLWPDSYYVRPDGMDFRSVEGKAWKKAHTGRAVISRQEERDINGMIAAVLAKSKARMIMEIGFNQPSIFCHHASTGILRKGRFDKLLVDSTNQPTIIDLKTVENGSARSFTMAIVKWWYHVQAAYYTDLLTDLIGETPRFGFVTVEKEPPYACTLYNLDADSLNAGRKQYVKDLELYARCRDNQTWPDYSDDFQTLRLPPYALDPHSPIIPD